MLTLITGILQYRRSYRATWLDFLPRGRWGGFYVAADIFYILSGMWLGNFIPGQTYAYSISVLVVLLAVFSVAIYINGKELERARSDINKARQINRQKGLMDAEQEAYLARIEMELKGLRARTKRHNNNIDSLVNENKHLKKEAGLLRRDNKNLEQKLAGLEQNGIQAVAHGDDSDQTVNLLSERVRTLEHAMQESNRKVHSLQLKNRNLKNRIKNLRNAPENKWMCYLPYAQGDSLAEVKRAYRALAKAFHPDVTDDGGERMKAVNEAWEQARKWFGRKNAQ